MITSPEKTRLQKRGFTLIEMLVAVGLLVFMMSIFAQIFSLATQSMVRQRGIGQNDQKARSLFMLIDGDLKKISYQPLTGEDGITPMLGNADSAEYPVSMGDPPWDLTFTYDGQAVDTAHVGYVYISENDPNDDTDDHFQFTVDARRLHPRNRDETPYYGRGTTLTAGSEDQPDFDDGIADGASVSDTAEVAYFLRNGNLYRRVLLVRNALTPEPSDTNIDDEAQPNNGAMPGGDSMNGYGGQFYRNFDFSAHYNGGIGHAQFHGTLNNSDITQYPLGVPNYRFGFHFLDGRPMEFYDGASGREFIGRHLHAETSDADFDYPQTGQGRTFLTGDGSDDLNNRKIMPRFADGTRVGEDILMTNVLSFDIRVWDAAVGNYVNLGNDDTTADPDDDIKNDYEVDRRFVYTTEQGNTFRSVGYGDRGPTANNIFDTWHPQAAISGMNGDTITQPMFRPLKFNIHNPAAMNPGTWNPGTEAHIWEDGAAITVATGDVVVPSDAYYESATRVQRIPEEFQNIIAFRAIVTGASGAVMGSGDPEPDWETATSLTDYKSVGWESNRIPDPTNPNVQWEPFFNLQPLKSMQITIRFRDPTSELIRQVTLVHTFAR